MKCVTTLLDNNNNNNNNNNNKNNNKTFLKKIAFFHTFSFEIVSYSFNCKINLYQHLNFMYRLENNNIPAIFNDIVKKPEHKYQTKFSSFNYT